MQPASYSALGVPHHRRSAHVDGGYNIMGAPDPDKME